MIVPHNTTCTACKQQMTLSVEITHQGQEVVVPCPCGYLNKFRYWERQEDGSFKGAGTPIA